MASGHSGVLVIWFPGPAKQAGFAQDRWSGPSRDRSSSMRIGRGAPTVPPRRDTQPSGRSNRNRAISYRQKMSDQLSVRPYSVSGGHRRRPWSGLGSRPREGPGHGRLKLWTPSDEADARPGIRLRPPEEARLLLARIGSRAEEGDQPSRRRPRSRSTSRSSPGTGTSPGTWGS